MEENFNSIDVEQEDEDIIEINLEEELDEQEQIKPIEESIDDNNEPAPKKGSLIFKILRYAIIAIASIVLCVSVVNIYKISHEYSVSDKEYDDIQDDIFVSPTVPNFIIGDSSYDGSEAPTAEGGYKFLNYDHNRLVAINADAIGYISLPAISTNLPVVHTDNNSYYLDHTINGTKNAAGCLFSDSRNTHGFDDPNTIIYGHSMKNGAMFGMLNRYMREDFYKTGNNKYFYIYTKEGIYKYEIFAACIVPDNSLVYYTSYTELTFKTIQGVIEKYALYDTGVTYDISDKILTLSTCVDNDDSKRLVVCAKRMN